MTAQSKAGQPKADERLNFQKLKQEESVNTPFDVEHEEEKGMMIFLAFVFVMGIAGMSMSLVLLNLSWFAIVGVMSGVVALLVGALVLSARFLPRSIAGRIARRWRTNRRAAMTENKDVESKIHET